MYLLCVGVGEGGLHTLMCTCDPISLFPQGLRGETCSSRGQQCLDSASVWTTDYIHTGGVTVCIRTYHVMCKSHLSVDALFLASVQISSLALPCTCHCMYVKAGEVLLLLINGIT